MLASFTINYWRHSFTSIIDSRAFWCFSWHSCSLTSMKIHNRLIGYSSWGSFSSHIAPSFCSPVPVSPRHINSHHRSFHCVRHIACKTLQQRRKSLRYLDIVDIPIDYTREDLLSYFDEFGAVDCEITHRNLGNGAVVGFPALRHVTQAFLNKKQEIEENWMGEYGNSYVRLYSLKEIFSRFFNDGAPGHALRVHGLPLSMTRNELFNCFRTFTGVFDAKIITDGNQSLGLGLVYFKEPIYLKACIWRWSRADVKDKFHYFLENGADISNSSFDIKLSNMETMIDEDVLSEAFPSSLEVKVTVRPGGKILGYVMYEGESERDAALSEFMDNKKESNIPPELGKAKLEKAFYGPIVQEKTIENPNVMVKYKWSSDINEVLQKINDIGTCATLVHYHTADTFSHRRKKTAREPKGEITVQYYSDLDVKKAISKKKVYLTDGTYMHFDKYRSHFEQLFFSIFSYRYLFVGNLSSELDTKTLEDELRKMEGFEKFVRVKDEHGNARFKTNFDARKAISELNGKKIGKYPIELRFGYENRKANLSLIMESTILVESASFISKEDIYSIFGKYGSISCIYGVPKNSRSSDGHLNLVLFNKKREADYALSYFDKDYPRAPCRIERYIFEELGYYWEL